MMQNMHTIDLITIYCVTCSIQLRCLKISSNTVYIASGIWIIHAVMHLWQVTSFVCQDFRKQCQMESEATVSHSTLIQIEGAFVWVDSQFAQSLLAVNHLVLAFYCEIWGACWGADHLLCQTFHIRLGEELYVETLLYWILSCVWVWSSIVLFLWAMNPSRFMSSELLCMGLVFMFIWEQECSMWESGSLWQMTKLSSNLLSSWEGDQSDLIPGDP